MANPASATSATIARLTRRLDWTLELLVALLIAAETCVVYVVVVMVLSSSQGEVRTIAPLWIFLLLYLSTTIQRAMDAYRFFSPEYEIVSVAALVVLFLAVVRAVAYPAVAPADLGWLPDGARALAFLGNHAARPLWGIVLLVAYAWYRGRTRDDPSIEAAYRLMRAGTPTVVAALIVTFAIVPDEAEEALRGALFAAVLGFFACTLAAIALGRLRIEHARGALTLTPRWLVTFLGPVVALVAVGTLLAGIFTRRFLDTLIWLLTPIFWLLDLLLLIMVYIATGLAWVIFNIFALILRLLGPGGPSEQRVSPSAPNLPRDVFNETNSIVYPDTFRYVGAAVLLGLIGWALTRFLWKRRRRREVAAGEERESVFSWGLLAGNLTGLFAGLAGRFARQPDPLAHLRDDPRWQHTVTIRELYGRVLRRGTEAKLPRADDQTPDEYAPVAATTGAPARPVSALTGRYDRARYGNRPATAEEAAAATAAWEAIAAAPTVRAPKGDAPGQ